MKRIFLRAGVLALFIGGAMGCASSGYIETRKVESETSFYQPSNPAAYTRLDANWIESTSDRSRAVFAISQFSTLDEYKQSLVTQESRYNKNPQIATDWPMYVFDYAIGELIAQGMGIVGVVFMVLVTSSDGNFLTTKEGQWQRQGEPMKSGSPVSTGQSTARFIPLQISRSGTLTLSGYDASGRGVGTYRTSFNFSEKNAISLPELTAHFSSRPYRLRLVGELQMPGKVETIQLEAEPARVAQFDFGKYAWKTPTEIERMKTAERAQQILAQQAAVAAEARRREEAEERRRQREEERAEREEEEERNAQRRAESDRQADAIVGMAVSAMERRYGNSGPVNRNAGVTAQAMGGGSGRNSSGYGGGSGGGSSGGRSDCSQEDSQYGAELNSVVSSNPNSICNLTRETAKTHRRWLARFERCDPSGYRAGEVRKQIASNDNMAREVCDDRPKSQYTPPPSGQRNTPGSMPVYRNDPRPVGEGAR